MFRSENGGRSGRIDEDWPMDELSRHESLFPPAFLLFAPETSPSVYCAELPWPDLSVIPRSPRPNESQSIRFFLNYHQQEIVPAHYFKWYDFHHFCKGWLPAMSEQSHALRLAIVSFSALIYSMKVNGAARYVAFYYYSEGLKNLHVLLNEDAMTPTECNVVIAIALQLSTIDVSPINNLANDSDSSATQLNVSYISKVLLAFFKISRPHYDIQRPCSVGLYWNGIAILKIIAALSLLVNICFLAYGGTKMYVNDSA